MIELLVDKAIASLLATIDGLHVFVGFEDNEPVLETPYCVVHSVVQNADGRNPIYELVTTIEYTSISGQNGVAGVETTMTAIDTLLTTQPTSDMLAALITAGLGYLGWQNIPKTQQDVGDRRHNIRELKVFAGLA
jgi:hypothetical protein